MYTYPIDFDLFSTQEAVSLVEFLSMIEDFNEGKKLDKNLILKKHQEFQQIVNSKSIEKEIDRDFQKLSGYSIYATIKKLK